MNKDLRYFLLYLLVSTGLITWSVIDSLGKAVDYLTFLVEFTDGFKVGIIINFIILNFMIVCKLVQLVMFGELRIIEIEHLMERLPIFSVNLLFNLATDDSNLLPNVVLLGLSIGFKIFHIILMDRLDFINLKIVNNLLNHSTKSSVLIKYIGNKHFWANFIIIFVDFSIAKFLVFDVFQGINSVTCLLFGFQFAVQGVEALTYFSKLLLTVHEVVMYRLEENIDDEDDDDDDQRVWDNKPYYNKGIEIASATLKSISYLSFIYLLTFHSGLSLPISLLQGTYSSLRQAYTEISQLLSFIELSKKFDSQLPTATQTDLEATDNLCIICREDMHSKERYQDLFNKPLNSRKYAKKLRCNHILHMGCLKEWLERSDSCPLCRNKVFDETRTSVTSNANNDVNNENNDNNDNDNNNNNNNNNINNNIQPPNPAEELQRRLQVFADMFDQPRNGERNVVNPPLPPANEIQERQIPDNSSNATAEINPITSTTSNIASSTNIAATSNILPSNTDSTLEHTPTRTIPSIHQSHSESTSFSTMNGFQTIRLPTTALLPPDWILFPLERKQEGEYSVSFSNKHKGDIKLNNRELNRDLRPS